MHTINLNSPMKYRITIKHPRHHRHRSHAYRERRKVRHDKRNAALHNPLHGTHTWESGNIKLTIPGSAIHAITRNVIGNADYEAGIQAIRSVGPLDHGAVRKFIMKKGSWGNAHSDGPWLNFRRLCAIACMAVHHNLIASRR